MAAVYRAEHVASFLRPQEVTEARVAFREGKISQDRLNEVTDRATLSVLERHCPRMLA